MDIVLPPGVFRWFPHPDMGGPWPPSGPRALGAIALTATLRICAVASHIDGSKHRERAVGPVVTTARTPSTDAFQKCSREPPLGARGVTLPRDTPAAWGESLTGEVGGTAAPGILPRGLPAPITRRTTSTRTQDSTRYPKPSLMVPGHSRLQDQPMSTQGRPSDSLLAHPVSAITHNPTYPKPGNNF